MQKSTLDTDFSYRLFGSEKSKLIDRKVCEKFASTGNKSLTLCERGTTFGYND